MSEQTGGHIFLSHGSENRDEANAMTRYLEERGLTVWIAPRDVRPGVDYSEALQEAIEACAAFIVLVTDKANKSPYVRVETEMAFSLHKPIFPVRTTDVKPGPGLALFLKIRHWTDAYGAQREESLERLARELRAAAGVADPTPGDDAEAPAPAGEEAPAAAVAAPAPMPGAAPVSAASSQWPSAAAASSAAPTQPAGAGAAPASGAAPADEEMLRAYVGPNADHYLARWRSGTGGWSWTAFLFTAFWAAYRKMWSFAAALAAAFLVLSVAGAMSPIVNALSGPVVLVVAVWFGFNANRLYRGQAEDALAGLSGGDRASALGRARAAGGTSVGAMAGLLVLFFAVNIGLFFLLRPTAPVPVTPAAQPGPQVVGEQPTPPQPADPGTQPQPDAQPRPADPNQPQQPQTQPQSGDEYYTPPAEEEPPTDGFYDPPQ